MFIPQGGAESLNPSLKIKTQIYEAFSRSGLKLTREQKRAYSVYNLARAGLKNGEEILEKYPFEISGGEAQRVVLAIAMCATARLIVADEATRGIDKETSEAFWACMDKDFADTALIIVTHDMSVAKRCDYVLVLKDGQTKEYGKANDVFPTRRASTPGVLSLHARRTMLEIVNVSKHFVTGKGKTQTDVYPLKNVSLTVENGKKVGLVGKSGEGKSTLANIVCGLVAPSEGRVLIDGQPLWSEKNRYDKKVGMAIQLIPQKPLLALDPSQRIGSAIKEALVFAKHAKRGNDATQKTYALFDEVGLEHTLASRLPVHLSGGQAQRAVIARALALNPKILVCDESTSMLDPTTQKSIVELLDKLVKEKNISLLFISHDMRLVDDFCDEAFEIKDGTLSKVAGYRNETEEKL